MEIREKRENAVIILYNKIYIFTSVYATNACSKWRHHNRVSLLSGDLLTRTIN